MPWTFSCQLPRAVRISTGVKIPASRQRRSRVSPSTPGKPRSSTTTSYRSVWARKSALPPSGAQSTAYPASVRACANCRDRKTSSSTTRTRNEVVITQFDERHMNGPFRNHSPAMGDNRESMLSNAPLDFGYPWWLSYGHVPILAVTAAFLVLGYFRKWSRWTMFVLSALAVWSGAGFVIERFVIDVNGRPALPTENFLRSGSGRVLDLGAGTGRSSIMVLEARPQTTLVALDLFAESFEQHFGPSQTPQQKLLANLKAAGVDQR